MQTVDVDMLVLIPTEAGYGKTTASYSDSPGAISARDSFTRPETGTGRPAPW